MKKYYTREEVKQILENILYHRIKQAANDNEPPNNKLHDDELDGAEATRQGKMDLHYNLHAVHNVKHVAYSTMGDIARKLGHEPLAKLYNKISADHHDAEMANDRAGWMHDVNHHEHEEIKSLGQTRSEASKDALQFSHQANEGEKNTMEQIKKHDIYKFLHKRIFKMARNELMKEDCDIKIDKPPSMEKMHELENEHGDEADYHIDKYDEYEMKSRHAHDRNKLEYYNNMMHLHSIAGLAHHNVLHDHIRPYLYSFDANRRNDVSFSKLKEDSRKAWNISGKVHDIEKTWRPHNPHSHATNLKRIKDFNNVK